jgi:hypothetical protein
MEYVRSLRVPPDGHRFDGGQLFLFPCHKTMNRLMVELRRRWLLSQIVVWTCVTMLTLVLLFSQPVQATPLNTIYNLTEYGTRERGTAITGWDGTYEGAAEWTDGDHKMSFGADVFQYAQSTIEFWMKAPVYGSGMLWTINCSPGSYCDQGFAILGDNKMTIIHPDTTWTWGTNALTAGVWYHIAFVHDEIAGSDTLYVNGQVETVANSNIGNVNKVTAQPMRIGGDVGGSATMEHLAIDDMRYSHAALSQAQILFDATYPNIMGDDADTEALYPLDGPCNYYGCYLAEKLAYSNRVGTPTQTLAFAQTGGDNFVNSTQYFNVSWAGVTYTPKYLYLYQDAEEPNFSSYTENATWTGSGSVNLEMSFEYPGTYQPIAILSDCVEPFTAPGCTAMTIQKTPVSMIISNPAAAAVDPDIVYDPIFEVNKRNDVAVDEQVYFFYHVDPASCGTGVTIMSKYFFKGYPWNIAYRDNSGSGTLLTASGGTLPVTYTEALQPATDFYFPYIELTCSNATIKKLYLQSTFHVEKAVGISVYTAEDLAAHGQVLITTWPNGGASPNFGAGTGAYFAGSTHVLARGEPFHLKYNYNVDFTPCSIVLFKDKTAFPNEYRTLSGAYLTQGVNHYVDIEYSVPGEYNPLIEVRSCSYNPSDASTFADLYLGGTDAKIPENIVQVTGEVYQSGGLAALTVSGSALGIFGLNPQTFAISLPPSAPMALRAGVAALNIILQAFLYLASYVFLLLAQLPFLSFVTNIVNPVPGTVLTTPATFFGQSMTGAIVSGQTFTITYADPSQNSLLHALQFILAGGVIVYAIKKFI